MIKIQNKKTIIVTIFVTLVFLIVLLALVLPAMREIKQLNAEILARRIELERLYREGQSIRNVTKDLDKALAELPRLEASLPRKGEELGFITTLEEMADKHHLNSRLEFSSATTAQKFGNLAASSVSISLLGSYRDLDLYLAEFDRLPYYVFTQSLGIHKETDEGTLIRRGGVSGAPVSGEILRVGNVVSATLEAIVYWKE